MPDYLDLDDEEKRVKAAYINKLLAGPQYLAPEMGDDDLALESALRQDILSRRAMRGDTAPAEAIESQARDRALLGLGTGLMGDAAKFGVQYATGPGESTMPKFEQSMLGAMNYRDQAQRQLATDREAARAKDIQAMKTLADMNKGKWTEGAKPKDLLDFLKMDQPYKLESMKQKGALGLEGKRQEGDLSLEDRRQKGKEALERLKASLKKPEEEKEKDKKTFQQESTLRQDYNQLSKKTMEASDAYQTMKSLGSGKHTPADQLAMMIFFMRVLDPTSTVRKEEAADVANTRNVPDSIRQIYNTVFYGGKLDEKQIKQLVDTAGTLYSSRLIGQRKTDTHYEKIANQYGLNPSNVVHPFDYSVMLPEAMRKAGGPVLLPQPKDIRVTTPDNRVIYKKKVSPEDIEKLKSNPRYKVEEL